MPVLESPNSELPEWSELAFYDILTLAKHNKETFTTGNAKQVLFGIEGTCRVTYGADKKNLSKNGVLYLPPDVNTYSVQAQLGKTVLVRVCGNWHEPTGSAGVFTLSSSGDPENTGDPVSYSRNTQFDNHYHDCDEYWIIVSGKGKIVTEGEPSLVEQGYCVTTRHGYHHDFPEVHETIRGVYFETTLRGRKREGHLWEHTHGKASPPT